jgi:hypothetical protein
MDPGARMAYALGLLNGDWRALLGELQVSFTLFLLIGSMVRESRSLVRACVWACVRLFGV